jgi:hypothetical protein
MLQDSFSFPSLSSHGVFNVVSTRSWKSINPFVGYDAVQRISVGLGIPDKEQEILNRVVFAEQVHSSGVHLCNSGDGGSIRLSVDALISKDPKHILAVYASDCIPILLYDPENQVIGVIHAGYRGLSKGIVENVINVLKMNFNSDISKVIIGFSPFIRNCCYEIKDDLFGLIEDSKWQSYMMSSAGKFSLDLEAIVRDKLLNLGITPEKIEDMGMCTACRSDTFFSFRKRQPEDERGSCCVSLISLSGVFQ